jgi:ribosomal protein S18 acetylase RimI-like enzyme
MSADTEIFEKPTYPRHVWRQYFDLYPSLFFLIDAESGGIAAYGVGAVAQDGRRGWVLTMGVRPEFRRMRCGWEIINGLVSAMERDGLESVSLTVKPTNEPARRLYERAGLSEVASEPDYFGVGQPRLLYQIVLPVDSAPWRSW